MPTVHDAAPRARALARVSVVGDGRMGRALAEALRGAGVAVTGPLGRGADAAGARVVLLAVPDAAIADAASCVAVGAFVGHLSGATTLAPLTGHRAFSLHPLTTVTAAGARFDGVPAAVAGSDDDALGVALDLAAVLGLRPFEVADADRVAYHAAAAVASNFLVTLEGLAERLAATAGVGRQALVPLVRASVENWARLGARDALTGPVARGDDDVVAAHRAAVAERAPDALELFDALVAATRDLGDTA
ncbi:DUF2520 domain-containing protein [Xylanimonas allomyrinae]|uniref:DUF2520 domain-containing protein n=1 Tax=Xylanimonas allomyrinae TaxID=2509459 RepID=A0A4P6EM14_9MICO|nr:DUF2520 domain-containing protein [Xylanimonas allomyrinae]QAY62763.1 DUF2520 domain-containing protein [Xylanimonas allomyrinae]